MKVWEALGLAAVAVVLVGTPAAVFAGQKYLNSPEHTYTLVGSAVEDGGWSPREITVHQGEHVRLRLTAADISHGLMVPALNINVPEIYPGKFTTVEFTATTPGKYPFMCTVLCSPRHGEMQGAIIVLPAEGAPATAEASPSAAPAASAEASASAPASSAAAASPAVESASPTAQPSASASASPTAQPTTSASPSASASAAPTAAPTTAPASSAAAGASADQIAAGKKVYQTFCLACHGPNAAGGIKLGNVTSADLRSSALNSSFGGDTNLIARAILNGKDASGKDLNIGMPRWQGQLSDAQVKALIAYLLHGT